MPRREGSHPPPERADAGHHPATPSLRTWHIISGEYPPAVGGVADYTASVAGALVDSGDRVHVWTSGTSGTRDGVVPVHRVFGGFGRTDLAAAGRHLDKHAAGGRLLVQWVPHAFGARGLNLRFPLWLYNRTARRPEPIDVMVHEPFVPFAGSARQHAAAVVQRVMTATVLRAASRAFVGTPAWAAMCRPLVGGRLTFRWTPIPSGIPVAPALADTLTLRRQLRLPTGLPVIGCFGRAGRFQQAVLHELGRALLAGGRPACVLLIGLGSDIAAGQLTREAPGLARAIRATGVMDAGEVSAALRACDVMIQPYPDGICARHSSAAALLAHGLPLATNSGRFTEPLWAESGAVRLVASGEAADLAASVLLLLDGPAERDRLSLAASALYDARFHVRHTVAALRN